jgi:hypothetical protein
MFEDTYIISEIFTLKKIRKKKSNNSREVNKIGDVKYERLDTEYLLFSGAFSLKTIC